MRPLNTRERRIQFFRFLALFLLAVLPIVLLVWLHGRVDHTENEFLKEHYMATSTTLESAANRKALFEAMKLESMTLRDLIASKKSDMESFSKNSNMSSNIGNQLDKLGKAIENLSRPLTSSPSDSLYLGTVDLAMSLHSSCENLNVVYGIGHANVLEAANALEKEQEITKKLKKALEKANGLLMPGQQVDWTIQ